MNHIYIGDRELDPPEEKICETCDGFGQVQDWTDAYGNWDVFDCPDCTVQPDPEPDNDPAR